MKNLGVAPRASAAAASDTIIVVVGPQQKHYTLHKRLLTHHSGYFRRVLEDGRGQCNLRNACVEDFDVFVDWMYEKTLPSYADTETNAVDEMIFTYILAANLSAATLKRALMDRIFDLVPDSRLTAAAVNDIFEMLPNNDPLLQLIVDTFCINNSVKDIRVELFAKIDDLPNEYLARVLRRLHQLSELPEIDRKLRREDYSMVDCMPHKGAQLKWPIFLSDD